MSPFLYHHSDFIWSDFFFLLIHCNSKEASVRNKQFFFVLQQQNLGRRFGTSKMHLRPTRQWLRLLSVIRRWFFCCWFIVYCCSHCLLGFCVSSMLCYPVLCDFAVLQLYWWGRESWLFDCLLDILWQSVFCGLSSQCRGLVLSVWLWYFLIILTCFLKIVFFVDSYSHCGSLIFCMFCCPLLYAHFSF